MIFKLTPLLFIITLKTARCSLVVDSIAQKGIYIADYCPNMKFCKEGSHVMCMYYDPKQIMGPRCSNAVNISITADLANQLLDVTNAIRSKIANGKETGKGGVKLPRAYGMFRMRWDNELATFAQVLANQCVLRHDLCRATKRFPDPGQTVGLVRFSYPDWSKAKVNESPGLNAEKLAYAITQSLKSWYGQKDQVDEGMLKKYPDWTVTSQAGKLYLEMIYAPSTHMGCGISGYTEYGYYNNARQNSYNSIQVVCNYSARPRKGSATYRTEPIYGSSGKCGCPKGSKEDSDCLCNEQKKIFQPRSLPPSCGENGDCETTLVLLPIFTVEDAPPDKLYQRAEEIKEPLKTFILQRLDNSTALKPNQSMDVNDFIKGSERENRQPAPVQHSMRTVFIPSSSSEVIFRASVPAPIFPMTGLPSLPTSPPRPIHPPPPPPVPAPRPVPPPPPPRSRAPPAPPADEYSDILRYHFNGVAHPEVAQPEEEEPRKTPQTQKPGPKLSPMTKKSSIFTKFKLPGRNNTASKSEPIKKDVTPRKDFSNLHKIVNDYLKRHPGYRRGAAKNKSEANKNETVLNKAEQTVITYNQYLKAKVNGSNNDKDIDIKDDNDNKLMSLLDTLEREVKNIELGGNKKELFDAKIRKIYGSVVGKPVEILTPIPPKKTTSVELDIPEIDIGESKTITKYESAHLNEDEKIPEEPKKIVKQDNDVDKKLDRIKGYDYLDRKRKDKTDNSDLKFYYDNVEQNLFSDVEKRKDLFDRKYNENYFDRKYMDDNHKHADTDRKYMDVIDRKYSENNLDRKYNAVQHKYVDNLDRKYQNLIHNKYDGGVFPSGNRAKYEINKDSEEFRVYKHIPLSSIQAKEDLKYFDKYADKDTKVGRGTLDINSYRNKDSDRKNRKRNKNRHGYNNVPETLSIERRKYYQEKLDNIQRKLRGSRQYRRRNDQRNERAIRRIRPNRDDIQRSRSNPQVDSIYLPERAKFLHGF